MRRCLARLIVLLILVTSSIAFFAPLKAEEVDRGIRIVAKSGESLYLYKDYYALVIGVSEYDEWPDLPNAANDAREVASSLEGLGSTLVCSSTQPHDNSMMPSKK